MKTKWDLIISDIDAGGGTILSLYYNSVTEQVKEIKEFADGKEMTCVFDLDEFNPEIYGKKGQEFMSLIF